MNIIEKAKQEINSGLISEESIDFLEDIYNAVSGNPVSVAKVLLTLYKSPFLIREKIFWKKMERFLSGVYLEEDDSAALCATLTENGNKNENIYRLIELIDRAETQKKIQYLINATRCLLSKFIDLEMYFRICHAVIQTLDADLLFLRNHIEESNLSYDINIQGLFSVGLMYQSIIDANDDGEQCYSFTPLASLVDRFAISYDDVERYPNPKNRYEKNSSLEVSISEPVIEKDGIDKLFGNDDVVVDKI